MHLIILQNVTFVTDKASAIITNKMPKVGEAPAYADIVSTQELVNGKVLQLEVKPGQYLIVEPFSVGA